MGILVQNIEKVKEFISSGTFNYEILKPYIVKAERKFIVPVIGDTTYGAYTTTIPTTGNNLKVYDLLCEASSNLAFFKYLPLGAVQVTDAGIMTSKNDHSQNAQWWQVRDLQRSFLNSGFEALDEALKIMELNPDDFVAWTASENYTVFKELFATRTDVFQKWFNISSSRRTFIALRPYLLETNYQYFNTYLGDKTITLIKTSATDLLKNALNLLQASQVNYAVAKAAENGMFSLTESGLFLKTNELPGDKTKSLDPAEIRRLVSARQLSGDEFFKQLKKLLIDNTDIFVDFELPSAPTSISAHNTKSIVSF